MRITFVLPTVNMSGGIRVAAIYAKALTERGHEVVLISPPPKPLHWKKRLRALVQRRRSPRQAGAPASHLDGLGLDHRILARWRPVDDGDAPDADLVIATWWETAEWVHALAPSKGRKVYFVQGHEVFPHLPVERCRATYRLPLHKIVIAAWLKEVMRSEYQDVNVDIVPNAVDRTQFHAEIRGRQPTPTIGFLYADVALKGVDVALAAIAKVRQRRPDIRLLCFGSSRPAQVSALPPGTEFHHAPAQDSIRNLYARCDVWLTASRSEGFNLPAMEAMACRTPVVSTRTGWPVEAIVTGTNGVLVDVDDVEALAAGIEWVLSRSDVQWRQLSLNAYETVRSSSWAASADLFERALMRIHQAPAACAEPSDRSTAHAAAVLSPSSFGAR